MQEHLYSAKSVMQQPAAFFWYPDLFNYSTSAGRALLFILPHICYHSHWSISDTFYQRWKKRKQLSFFLEFIIFHPNQSYALYSNTQEEFRLLQDLKHNHVPSALPQLYKTAPKKWKPKPFNSNNTELDSSSKHISFPDSLYVVREEGG